MSRYEDAPPEVIELVEGVRDSVFPELRRAKIKVLFDLKGRRSRGQFILGRIQAASQVVRYLTRQEARSEKGFDYILYLDKQVFQAIERADQIRLIRHELRHCFFDPEARANPYKLVGHEVEDFLAEIEYNQNDAQWRQRLAAIAASLYDQD